MTLELPVLDPCAHLWGEMLSDLLASCSEFGCNTFGVEVRECMLCGIRRCETHIASEVSQ